MIESPLGNAVVVGRCVLGQGGLEFIGTGEPSLGDDLADSAVEAVGHAVGLGVAWRAQSVLDSNLLALLVEGMYTAGVLVLLVSRSVNWNTQRVARAMATNR